MTRIFDTTRDSDSDYYFFPIIPCSFSLLLRATAYKEQFWGFSFTKTVYMYDDMRNKHFFGMYVTIPKVFISMEK